MPSIDSKPTSDKEQTQIPQTYLYAPPYQQQFEDDTIDLYELWITLLDKKWLVIAVTVITALGSLFYALRQPTVYKAEAFLLPPEAIDIQSLNVENERIVFGAFKKNLSSRRLKRKFIKEQGLMDVLAPGRSPETRDIEILEGFSTMIKVEDVDSGEGISVSTISRDPEFAAKIVNDYINFLDIETVRGLSAGALSTIEVKIREVEDSIGSKKQMEIYRREDQIRDLESSISSKRKKAKKLREDQIKDLENSILSKREQAKKLREDKIKLFEEAAVIATRLEFRDPVDMASINIETGIEKDQANVSTNPFPLYYRGYRALRAEIEFLKNRESDDPFILNLRDLQQELAQLRSRKSDDPFIYGLRELQVEVDRLRSIKSDYTFFPGLRDLQEELALLRSIKINQEGQHAVTVDQAAYPPKYPITRSHRMITTLGTMAGLFSGIFLAFFVAFVQKQKKIHSA